MTSFLKRFFKIFNDFPLASAAASLSFYTTLSIAPILILLLKLSKYLDLKIKSTLQFQTKNLLRPEIAKILNLFVENNREVSKVKVLGTWFGILILLFSASLVFSDLRRSLNMIFHIQTPNLQKKSVLKISYQIIKQEIFHVVSVLILILFLVLFLTTTSSIFQFASNANKSAAIFINSIVAFLFYSIIFTGLFRYMPERRTPWLVSMVGSVITVIFFIVGTQLVGIYLANNLVADIYGIFGSFLLFLIWVYYSCMIILLGAQVCASIKE
ncbi:MAG: YhjD/YihY/BrkB family envelope integrity protein [Bacteriovoracaceae bacterium]|nr:YhjD/YihY/BrkB family envelope integrity protein [Bacteriovoracaceae bacterium]